MLISGEGHDAGTDFGRGLGLDFGQPAEVMPTPARFARQSRVVRFEALGILDGAGAGASPGALLVEFFEPPSTPDPPAAAGRWSARVLASGRLLDVALHEARCAVVRLPRHVLIPGLVNAHSHLDLTHVGPLAYDPTAGFVGWISGVGPRRLNDPEAVRQSVRAGVKLAIRGGTVAVGDIAGAVDRLASTVAFEALQDSGLSGVSFLEFFAAGSRERVGLDGLERALEAARARGWLGSASARRSPLRLGIQPHAPYSVSPASYRRAFELAAGDTPVATHLSESAEERRLIEHADGPLMHFLQGVGVWNDQLAGAFGHARSPVEHFAALDPPPHVLLAHANHAGAADIRLLASINASVVFCPRAWAYFDHLPALGEHPYQHMLRAGVNVALGTDSIINLPPDVLQRGVSILDEMRTLSKLHNTDPATLLAMGTINGARALGLPEPSFTFQPGALLAGLAAVCVLDAGELPPIAVPSRTLGTMLLDGAAGSRPELLFGGTFCGLTGMDSELASPSA